MACENCLCTSCVNMPEHRPWCTLDHGYGGCFSEGLRDAIRRGADMYTQEVKIELGENLIDEIENEVVAFYNKAK